jgi:PhnB protein
MTAAVSPIPPGYHTLTPHIIVGDAKKAADFYQKAFGAEVRGIAVAPDGVVIHAEVKIGDSIMMFNEEVPHMGVLSPKTTKASTCVTLHMYVKDADKVFAAAVAAGAKVIMPLEDQFWGDRYGTVEDPFGHRWSIATHIKDMTPEEMKTAMDEAIAKMSATHA